MCYSGRQFSKVFSFFLVSVDNQAYEENRHNVSTTTSYANLLKDSTHRTQLVKIKLCNYQYSHFVAIHRKNHQPILQKESWKLSGWPTNLKVLRQVPKSLENDQLTDCCPLPGSTRHGTQFLDAQNQTFNKESDRGHLKAEEQNIWLIVSQYPDTKRKHKNLKGGCRSISQAVHKTVAKTLPQNKSANIQKTVGL